MLGANRLFFNYYHLPRDFASEKLCKVVRRIIYYITAGTDGNIPKAFILTFKSSKWTGTPQDQGKLQYKWTKEQECVITVRAEETGIFSF